MNEEPIHSDHSPPASKSHLRSRLSSYKSLLARRWWVLAAGAALGVAVVAVVSRFQAPSFVSVGRMIVSIKLTIPEGSVYSEEMSAFLGTQAALMQSGLTISRARTRVAAEKPNLQQQPVKLKVTVLPRTSIFVLEAIGDEPQYTQAFLQACIEEYINLKREMRAQTSDTTVGGLTEEVLRLEKDLRGSEEDLVAFEGSNSVVLLQDQGNSAGNYLAALNQRLAAMRSEYELLQTLTLDQNLERRQEVSQALPADNDTSSPSAPGSADSTASDYLRAKQQILLLKADQQDMAQYLRPKHPKMIAISEEIARRERLLDIFRQQSADQLESRKKSIALQIQNLEKDVKEWDAKTLDINRKSAEYQRLKGNSQRIQALYDRLLGIMQTLNVNKEVSPESVTVMEKACPAFPDRPNLSRQLLIGGLVGLGLGVALLMVLHRLDDRLTSLIELRDGFDEEVLGQVPMEKPRNRKGQLKLIEAGDDRHAFVEAFRNLRSSLLYMAQKGQRPKTLLLTSSIPNEGKSVTAANLAISLANAASRVLLVDADLRKGDLHNRFGLESGSGLCEVLSNGLNWEAAVQATAYPNLSLLARGGITDRSSELFISPSTERFLKEASARYDFVILDTAPVMAADDVTNLAPQANAVLFVLRAEHTSAGIAHAALDLLYQRQVRVLGIVFNAIRPTSGDYYYYKYKDYYASYPAGKGGRNKGKEEAAGRSAGKAG